MALELDPSAASSYARPLIARGCPATLAHPAAQILAQVDGHRARTPAEQQTVDRTWQGCQTTASRASDLGCEITCTTSTKCR